MYHQRPITPIENKLSYTFNSLTLQSNVSLDYIIMMGSSLSLFLASSENGNAEIWAENCRISYVGQLLYL